MSSPPTPSPNPHPSRWSPIVLALVGTVGTLFLVFTYFNILRRCSFRSAILTRTGRRRLLHRTNSNSNSNSINGNNMVLQFSSRGLDSFAVQMIPVTQFSKKTDSGKENAGDKGTECAICLGEYEDDEWVKTIPVCLHVFHVSCIDTWFRTHSSCPLCRSDVLDIQVSVSDHVSEDVVEDRSVFYQVLRSHIVQNSNFARL